MGIETALPKSIVRLAVCVIHVCARANITFSVDVLGHIFEQSITDLEELRRANPPYVRQELLTAYKDHWQDLERTIAAAVHEAYGLTAEDLELLRATQPPRMPPGW